MFQDFGASSLNFTMAKPRISKPASFRSTVIELEDVKRRLPQKEWQALPTNF